MRKKMARWQNGYVADCKSVYAGSIPARASIFSPSLLLYQILDCVGR